LLFTFLLLTTKQCLLTQDGISFPLPALNGENEQGTQIKNTILIIVSSSSSSSSFKVLAIHGLLRFRILTSELMNLFGHFGRTPWTGDQTDAKPLSTQKNTTQKNADTYPCPKRDSNPRAQCSSGRRQYVPQTA